MDSGLVEAETDEEEEGELRILGVFPVQ